MAERSEMDNERLSRAYTRYAKDPTVDVNGPDNIIIALEKECEHYRDKIGNLESQIKEAAGVITELHRRLEAINETTLEAVQDNTMGDIIKALADNGYNTITINCYKGIESEE